MNGLQALPDELLVKVLLQATAKDETLHSSDFTDECCVEPRQQPDAVAKFASLNNRMLSILCSEPFWSKVMASRTMYGLLVKPNFFREPAVQNIRRMHLQDIKPTVTMPKLEELWVRARSLIVTSRPA